MATSSVTKRTWKQGEVNRHHLIDPRTGEPAQSDWLCATVIADDTVTAEVYAKALLIGGPAEVEKLTAHNNIVYLVVDHEEPCMVRRIVRSTSMSTNLSTNNSKEEKSAIDKIIRGVFLVALLLFFSALMLAFVLILQTPAGSTVSQAMNSLFALDSVQMWWYVTRAAGLTGYFLLWLSMAWGLAIANKILHPAIEGSFTYDFHEFLSLLGIGFILLHVIVLLFDRFLPFNVAQTVIPFIDTYRPFWVGLGIIGFYLFLLVTLTFYMRKAIGMKAFRSIHALVWSVISARPCTDCLPAPTRLYG